MSQWLSSQGTERHGRWQVQERHICTDKTIDIGIVGVFFGLDMGLSLESLEGWLGVGAMEPWRLFWI